MKSALVKAFGSVDQLEIVERGDPSPQPGQVIFRIKACGLNFADILQRQGHYHGGPKPPFVPGMEAAGIVESVAPGTTGALRIGMRVAVLASRGLHAERAAAMASHCIHIPDAVSFEETAAFPVQFLTAYHALFSIAKAVPGETILINAAAGGLGTASIQIAVLAGLRVAATVSSEEKRKRVLALGAELASTYDSFDADVRRFTAGRGPEIVFETVGGEIFRRSLALLRPMGRLILLGISSADIRTIEPTKLLYSSKAVMGFHLSALLDNPNLLNKSVDDLVRWLMAGKLKPQIGHIFSLADIRKAHALLEHRNHYGKIVLIP